MTKIVRATQKVFGGDLVATNNIATFGSLKAGTPAYSNDPAVIQSLAAWVYGWAAAVVNNQAPAMQDVNAVDYLFSRQIAYILQQGIPEWDSATEYCTNSYVQVAGVVYQSLQDINTNHAVTDLAWWHPLLANGLSGTVSSSTSGQIGTSNNAAREDHNHHLGAHTHTDAGSGGVVVAASATQQGTVTTGAQTFAGKKTFNTPPQIQVVQSGIAAGDSVLDCSVYDTFVKTGSASATTITISNMSEGQTISLLINTVISQGNINWATSVKWNGGIIPTPTYLGSRYDRYIFQMLGGVIFGSADMNCY